MPGIAGIISRRPAADCQSAVDSMIASMKFESFYRTGTHHVPETGIYAGWVALNDSPNAHQVFCNEEGNITLLFSGECYADPSLRSELRAKQHQFGGGRADWLVHFYEEKGLDFFKELNGFFSGVLMDGRTNQIFVFNDRYGIERIYFHESTDAFYFASEAKALLSVVPELRAFDDEGVAQFLAYGCTLNGSTFFTGIKLMPGGSLWTFENHRCNKGRYFSPATWEAQSELPAASFEARFQETFKSILPRYFESDTRVGISLTAGLDTRMIMSCLPGHIESPVCYTYAEADNETLDARLATAVAEACGLEHHLLRLGPDFFENFGSYADRTVYITDGCSGVLGSHEIVLNQMARQWSTVRMTGNFGSEVLRDVSTFKPSTFPPGLLDPELQQSVTACSWTAGCSKEHPVGFAAFKEIPWGLFGTLCAGRSQVTFRTPYLDNELVALAFQAPDSIRKSNGVSLKLISDNNRALASILTDQGAVADNSGFGYLSRRIFEEIAFRLDYYFNEGMPHALVQFDPLFNMLSGRGRLFGRHKFLHYRQWLRKELAEYLRNALGDVLNHQSPFWNRKSLEALADDHIQGRKNNIREINAVLTLGAVERQLIRLQH